MVVRIKEAPDGKKATATLDNNVNPHWNEDLTYLLPDECESNIIAEVWSCENHFKIIKAREENKAALQLVVSAVQLQELTFFEVSSGRARNA